MSVFKTTDQNGLSFTRAPFLGKSLKSYNGKGWNILAHSNGGEYGGHYTRAVGFADETSAGVVPFRLKRTAAAAMREAINLGILKAD